MIRLQAASLSSVDDARASLQSAVDVEFSTLPPYLYALYSIRPGTNEAVAQTLREVVLEEMEHMCLACNILNALDGTPTINPPTYPGPLPGDIGPAGEPPLEVHLFPFSPEAMEQGMKIEQPEHPPEIPERDVAFDEVGPRSVSIGEFYGKLDAFLETLPDSDWKQGHNQLTDSQFLTGQIFPVNGYKDAHEAIHRIVTEGEGTPKGTDVHPLDFEGEVAHYFRFGEVFHGKVLTKVQEPPGYTWGPQPFGVDWAGAYSAIADPGTHDFSADPRDARDAQMECDMAFTAMVDALGRAVRGESGALGEAVQTMFRLRMAALRAFTIPLADGVHVAGPAFRYLQNDGVVR